MISYMSLNAIPWLIRNFFQRKKVIKPSSKCLWVAILQTGSGHATWKIGTVLV